MCEFKSQCIRIYLFSVNLWIYGSQTSTSILGCFCSITDVCCVQTIRCMSFRCGVWGIGPSSRTWRRLRRRCPSHMRCMCFEWKDCPHTGYYGQWNARRTYSSSTAATESICTLIVIPLCLFVLVYAWIPMQYFSGFSVVVDAWDFAAVGVTDTHTYHTHNTHVLVHVLFCSAANMHGCQYPPKSLFRMSRTTKETKCILRITTIMYSICLLSI